MDLYESGLEREGHRLFELAEPLDLLSGRMIPDDHTRRQNLWDILVAWVHSAVLFRNADEIVETIRRIRVSPRGSDSESPEAESLRLQNWLIFQGALACCDWDDWQSWQILCDALDAERYRTLRMFTLLRSTEHAQDYGNFDRVRILLPDLISNYPLVK